MSDVLVRPGKVAQWGNSAAVRVPAAALDRANLHVDDLIDVIATDDEIIIRRQRPRVRLSDLLARFDPEKHRHELYLDDAPVGKETW